MLRAASGTLLFALGIETVGRLAYRRLLAAAEEPRAAQQKALAQILRALAPTELGRRFQNDLLELFLPPPRRAPVPVTPMRKIEATGVVR